MEEKSTYFISLSQKNNWKIYCRWKNMAILLTNWTKLSPSILIFPPAGEEGCFRTGRDVNFRWIIRPQKKSQAQSSVLPRPCFLITVLNFKCKTVINSRHAGRAPRQSFNFFQRHRVLHFRNLCIAPVFSTLRTLHTKTSMPRAYCCMFLVSLSLFFISSFRNVF